MTTSLLGSPGLFSIFYLITTIGITVTFIFHSFFSSLAKSKYMSLFLLSLNFTLWSAKMTKFTIRQILFSFLFFLLIFFFFFFFFFFFLLIVTWFGVLDGIGWSVSISKPQIILCVSFSRTDSGLCMYHLVI